MEDAKSTSEPLEIVAQAAADESSSSDSTTQCESPGIIVQRPAESEIKSVLTESANTVGIACNSEPTSPLQAQFSESRDTSEEFGGSNVSSLTANSNSTSMSSITYSSGDYRAPPGQSTNVPVRRGLLLHQNSIHLNKQKKLCVKDLSTPPPLAKTLSFRTDSSGSLGSLVSNVDIPTNSPSSTRLRDTDSSRGSFDSATGFPRKFNNHNVSSSSILVTALKQSNRRAKKTVSFSIPSDDDIARRVRNTHGSLLYSTLDAFDDSIPDYQVASPKSVERGPRMNLFTSPLRPEPVHRRSTGSPGKPSAAAFNSTLPPLVPMHAHSVGSVPSYNHSHIQSSSQQAHNNSNHHVYPTSNTKNTPPLTTSNHSSGPSVAPAVAPEHSVAVLSLMQRVGQATTTQELCELFEITTESVFLGG